MSETRWPSPTPPSEPVLTLIVAGDAAEASAWINRFAVDRAVADSDQHFAFWVPDPAARRSEIMALAPSVAGWIDQRFSFHQFADLAEDMTRPPIAKRMVIDPFDPHRDWRVGYATENEHVRGKFDRLRAFAAPHQVRCWLIGRPLPKFDFRPRSLPQKL